MSNPVFISRKGELERLKMLYKKEASSLVVVKGRRRIGKSRLIRESAQISRTQTLQQRAHFAGKFSLMPLILGIN